MRKILAKKNVYRDEHGIYYGDLKGCKLQLFLPPFFIK